jgi:hypothetical protein
MSDAFVTSLTYVMTLPERLLFPIYLVQFISLDSFLRKTAEFPLRAEWSMVSCGEVPRTAGSEWGTAGSEWERELDAVLQEVDTSAKPILYVRASQYCSRL